MKKIFILLLFGLATHLFWTLAMFVGYIVTGGSDTEPTLPAIIVAGGLILVITLYLGMRYGSQKQSNALTYSAFTTITTFVLNLLISIPNETTRIFFGSWFVYITFFATFLGGYFGCSQTNKAKKPS